MTRKKGKSISFDAMVKFFIQNYNIPTRKDIDKLQARLDRIENLLKLQAPSKKAGTTKAREAAKKAPMTALDTVHDIIKRSRNGSSFKDLQTKTGYDDKKIRNLIFRLNKMGRIERKRRGIYIAS